MISDLFLNACILISFISIYYLSTKNKDINNKSSIFLKIIIGIYSGLLGIILMIYSVQVTPNMIIDFRYIAILLAALYGGFLPSIVASIIMGAFRVLYFGVSQPSIIALIITLASGIGFSIISSLKVSRKSKWIFSIIYLFLVFSIGLFFDLEVSILFYKTIGIFFTANICVCWILFIYTGYLNESIELNKKLKHEATKDFLTGLNNVRQFDTSFNAISKLTLKKEEKLSLLFIDVDFFKKINDTYGHNAGDIVLKVLGEIFIDTFRTFDIISRNGGEEFSVLLLDCSSDHAVKIAERLRKKVEIHKFNISDKTSLDVTISIGVSTYPDTTNKIDNLVEDADNALYEAKENGRNRVVLYKNYN